MGGRKRAGTWVMLKQAGSDFMEDRALRLSAAMAYYAVFSIGPLLFLVVGIAGMVFGEEAVRREVEQQLRSLMGEQSTGILNSMMSVRKQGGSILATVIGGVGLILGASGVFGQLQDALNTIWEVKAKPGGGIWGFLRARFLSFGMVLVIGFLLLLSMVLTTIVHAAAGQISAMVSGPEWIAQIVNIAATFLVITLLFASIFKFLPDVKIKWSYVWIGAAATALLYTAGKMVLGWYLGRESTASAYGAGGAFIVILLYIYYSSVILFFGAEFTQVYARQRGTQIVPSEHAVSVTEEERAKQGMPRDREAPRNRPKTSPPISGAGPAQADTHREHIMKTSFNTASSSPILAKVRPLDQIRARPYSFVGLAIAAGMAAGLFFKIRTLRTGLKWYLAARRLL